MAGAGNHVVSCQAHNGAVDPQGQYAYSATRSWSLDIGQPTVSAIGFAKIADALKCARVREQVTVPAHWVTVRRHHKLVRVRKPAHTKTVTVERCHARIVWRRETVLAKVRRHGKLVSVKRTKRVRVAAHPPHRDQDQDTGRVRPRNDREWLAGNRQRHRARRCAGADLDRARTTDKACSPPPPRPRLPPTARGASNSRPGPHDSSKPSTAAAPACCP